LLGALAYLLPEIAQLKGVSQSSPHSEDVFGHSLATLQWLEQLLSILAAVPDEEAVNNLMMGQVALRLGRYRQRVKEHLETRLNPERTDRSVLFLAALYHDAGKPFTRQVDSKGRIRFFKHEEIGAQIVTQRAKNFNLSNLEGLYLATIVRHHMRPLWLAHQGDPLRGRTVYRFFRNTEAAGVDICLLGLADVLSTYGTNLPPELWARHLEVVDTLLAGWWERPQELVSPPRLVNGDDLMAKLHLSPGPQIGRLLEAIREAQASGEVSTPQQAIELAGAILAGKTTPE
jgi:putative nucleotidyltransferase with HDIG domain